MKKNSTILLALACIMASCNNQQAASSDSADSTKTAVVTDSSATANQDGWITLFDGTSTKGWHSYGHSSVGDIWQIQDGALYADTTKKVKGSHGNNDLVTDDEYENYDLKLEWKISPNGNSGIIFNIKEDTTLYKNTYNTGLEMQVLDNNGHPDAKIIKHRAGDLYDLISSSKETVKPVGEWNQAEIVVKDGKLDLFLNGTNVVSTTLWDDNWKKLVAGSKFKNMPGFGTFKKGKIALQEHNNAVWYRNIQIKKL